MADDFAAEFDGETARLSIQHVYPEDEGEYTCVAYNDLGKAYTSACLVVDGNFTRDSCDLDESVRCDETRSAGDSLFWPASYLLC